jgi:acetyl esterase/lipase
MAAVPARTENLAGLAPAWIGVGTPGLFVAEAIDYALRLFNAGVATDLSVVPGAFHAFDFVPGAKISKQFATARINALRHAFGMESIL